MNNVNTTTTDNGNGKQPKALLVDVDFRRSGTTSIARSDEEIKRLFGYPPLHIKSARGFKMFMDALGKRVDKEVEYGIDSVFELNPKFKDLDFIVFDTLSGMQSFISTDVLGPKSTMTQGDWGKLGIIMNKYLMDISNMPCHVVCLSHSKMKMDPELGIRLEVPALSGQIGEQLGKYFDNILYTNVSTDKTGKRTYRWQGAADEHRNCRGLPKVTEAALENQGLLEQDFVKLYDLIRTDTIEPVKTLLIGAFGTGKTYSLKTLANIRLL